MARLREPYLRLSIQVATLQDVFGIMVDIQATAFQDVFGIMASYTRMADYV